MKCIYLDKAGFCKAHPSNVIEEWKPDEETQKKYCNHSVDMQSCPRMRLYQDHLKALKGQ